MRTQRQLPAEVALLGGSFPGSLGLFVCAHVTEARPLPFEQRKRMRTSGDCWLRWRSWTAATPEAWLRTSPMPSGCWPTREKVRHASDMQLAWPAWLASRCCARAHGA